MVDETHAAGTSILTRGEVSARERSYAEQKVLHLLGSVRGPVLFSKLELTHHADPARERPNFAKAEVDLNGQVVRAHVTAATMLEAVDLLEARLRERLERATRRDASVHLRHRKNGDGGWRHGAPKTPRPQFFDRAPDDREIVRHKTFALAPMTPDEAVTDLDDLDHFFYLFENLETGEDNVIARTEDDQYELYEPTAICDLTTTVAPVTHSPFRPIVMSLEEARDALELTERIFLFFLEPDEGRGRVLYRRYDGHYGLIVTD